MRHEYRTPDVGIASYLTALGYRMVCVDGASRHKEFVFARKRGRAKPPEDAALEFESGKGSVNPKVLIESVRIVKGELRRATYGDGYDTRGREVVIRA